MFKMYAKESFSKRMLGSGIACPLVAIGAGAGLSAMSGPINWNSAFIMAGLLLGVSAVIAFLATYYWKVTAYMLVTAARSCLAAIWNWFAGISFAGFFAPVIACFFCMLAFLFCVAVAVGPYLGIPLGYLYLVSQAGKTALSKEAEALIYILVIVLNMGCVGFFHFFLPIRALRREYA